MPEQLNCSCGYSGPSVSQGERTVCPICHTPAGGEEAAAARRGPPPVPPARRGPTPPPRRVEPEDSGIPLTARETFRIPCPNGHVNVSPAHLLGTQVVCPKCNAFYALDLKNSLEYRREADRAAIARAEKDAQKWLAWAIYAAIFIVVSLVGMVVWSFVRP